MGRPDKYEAAACLAQALIMCDRAMDFMHIAEVPSNTRVAVVKAKTQLRTAYGDLMNLPQKEYHG